MSSQFPFSEMMADKKLLPPIRLISVVLVNILVAAGATFAAQHPSKDVSAIYAEGKITGHQYRNDYFGLTLTVDEAQFTQGAFVNVPGRRARLVDAQANAKNPEDRYEFAILADELDANPAIHSPEQYVGAVRHAFEKEGDQTVEKQFAIEISGVRFAGAGMRVDNNGSTHYRGIFTTFLKGYIFSLDVQAASLDQVKKLAREKLTLRPAAT